MAGWRKHLVSIGIAAAVLAVGGGAFAVLMLTAPAPETNEGLTPPRIVRVFEAKAGTHRIAMTSYGVAQAADELVLRSAVEGDVQVIHDDFEEGQVVRKDTPLAGIDPTDYQNAYDLALAEVAEQELRIEVLNQRTKNATELLSLREEQVRLSKSELDRAKELLDRRGITPNVYEDVQKLHVDNKTALQNLRNDLALVPKELAVERKKLEAAKLRRDRAKDDLDDCTIELPFTGLCLAKEVELHEKAEKGQTLGRFMRLEKAEVLAMIEPRKAMMLFPNAKDFYRRPIDLTSDDFNDVIERRLVEFAVTADVTWRVGEGQAQWRGKAVRVSPIVDERTRTAPAVIEIADAYTNIQPGVRPALIPGMFLDVTLYGETLSGVFVLPRDAVHEDQVYVERNGKLRIVDVHVAAREEDRVVVDGGLSDGDRVILTDLFPVANGMRVTAQKVDNPVSHRPKLPELRSELTPE